MFIKPAIMALLFFLCGCSIAPNPGSAGGGNNSSGSSAHNYNIATAVGSGNPGYSGDNGSASSAQFNAPYGVFSDPAGNLYIADCGNNVIRKVSTNGIVTTVAGKGSSGNTGDSGPATNAELSGPSGVCVDSNGVIYIADSGNNSVRKVDTNGIISTIVSSLDNPMGLCLDKNGNLYISDYGNFVIRKLNPSGVLSVIAGTIGTPGCSGDGGYAVNALLGNPRGLFADNAGNLYIADFGFNVIRLINPSGIIHTLCGSVSYGYSGDGGKAVNARLFAPGGVYVDSGNNIFIADTGNNVIRKIDAAGIITTIAGTAGTNGYSGDNGPATAALMNYPVSIWGDSSGSLYIADANNYVIRKLY